MALSRVARSRSEASSPAALDQSTHVFENLAKKLHRLESKLGRYKFRYHSGSDLIRMIPDSHVVETKC